MNYHIDILITPQKFTSGHRPLQRFRKPRHALDILGSSATAHLEDHRLVTIARSYTQSMGQPWITSCGIAWRWTTTCIHNSLVMCGINICLSIFTHIKSTKHSFHCSLFKGCRPCRRPRKNWQWMKPNWQKYLSVLRTCRFSPFSNVYFHEIYLICLNEIYLIKYLI